MVNGKETILHPEFKPRWLAQFLNFDYLSIDIHTTLTNHYLGTNLSSTCICLASNQSWGSGGRGGLGLRFKP